MPLKSRITIVFDRRKTKPNKGEKMMVKKMLCCVVLVLTSICVLVSCGGHDNNNETTATHTHFYGEWETTKNANCTAEGSKERYCYCGEKQTATISMTGHIFGEWETIKEASCLTDGEKVSRCRFCDVIEKQIISATGHTYGEWEVSKATTCKENGEKIRICTFCNDVDNLIILSSDEYHDYKDATCTLPKTCSICFATVGSSLGHSYSAGVCTNCNDLRPVSLRLPSTPISVSYIFNVVRGSVEITTIDYEINWLTTGKFSLSINVKGEKIYDVHGDSCSDAVYFLVKAYDSDGYLVDEKTYSSNQISVGEKFQREKTFSYDFDPSETYTIVIGDSD